MGATLEQFDLTSEDYGGLPGKCHEALVLNRPDVIEGVHASMVEAGAEVVETDTFQASRLKLDEWGLGEHTLEINRKAAEIARKAVGEARFVAGSIGPTGFLPASDDPTLGDISFRRLVEVFTEQARGLVEGGADLIIIETAQDILEVKAAIFGAREAFEAAGRTVPIQASVSLLPQGGKMLLGTDIQAVLTTLTALDVDVIGLNCSTGPEDMRDAIRYLGEHSPLPVHCIPNAGLPLQGPDGETIFPETPEQISSVLGEFVERHDVGIVGGCCGTTPDHIRALAERVAGRTPGERPAGAAPGQLDDDRDRPRPGAAADAGRRARQLAGLAQGEGAAARRRLRRPRPGRRGPGDRRRPRARRLRRAHRAPGRGRADARGRPARLADPAGADPDRLDRARGDRGGARADPRPRDRQLDQPRGRARQARPRDPARQGARRGADRADDRRDRDGEDGRAQARDREADHRARLRRARPRPRAADLRRAHLHADHRRRRVEAVRDRDDRGDQAIKEGLPGVKTSLGVSNVSFGVCPPARAVLNSVFLHHCVDAGLDLAMVNPNHITPYGEIPENERELADDLVFNRREDALERFIDHFESKGEEDEDEAEDPTEDMEPEEALHWHILRRKKEGVEDWIDRSVEKIGAVPTLNKVLLPAMKEVGDKFGAGELILPFVLQSAEVMKRAVAQLENYLDRIEGHTKGKVVIATVFGDVHDIGKSLVNTILTNNGYTVVDLGKQVPIDTIIDAAVEHEADAIGLSALLVSTSKQMPACIQELHQRGLEFPVLIGGAAINRDFGRRVLYPHGKESDEVYEPGVFYCKDAFAGLDTVDALIDDGARAALLAKIRDEAQELREKPVVVDDAPPTTDDSVRSARGDRRADPRAAVLGRARRRDRPRRRLPLPRPPRAVQAPLGRARAQGRGVAPDRRGPRRRRGLRAEARAHVARAGLPGARRASATSRATPTATSSSSSTPTITTARSSVSSSRASPSTTGSAWPTSTGRSGGERDVVALQAVTVGRRGDRADQAARGRRRVRRAALRPRPRRAGGRGPRRVAPRRGPPRPRDRPRPGPPLLLGLPRLPGPVRAREGLAPARASPRSGSRSRAATRSSPSSRRWRSSPTTRRPSTSA